MSRVILLWKIMVACLKHMAQRLIWTVIFVPTMRSIVGFGPSMAYACVRGQYPVFRCSWRFWVTGQLRILCSIFSPIQQLCIIMRSVICSQWTERQHGIESRRCHTTTFRTTNAATNEEVPQLDETADGAIAVEPAVFNFILEVGALTAASTTTTNQETSTTAIPCRTVARSNANAWKQAAPHRDVLPLNDSSPNLVARL